MTEQNNINNANNVFRDGVEKHEPFSEALNRQMVFDLNLSNDQRIKFLFNMDKSSQFESIKRLIDIYNASNVKKLEKFLIYLCKFDDQIDIYLKQEMLHVLSCKVSVKNKHLLHQPFSNVLFLMIKKALNFEEYWLMYKTNFILYNSIFKDQNNYVLLKNIIILVFKKFTFTKKELAPLTLRRSIQGADRPVSEEFKLQSKNVSDPFNKIFDLMSYFKNELYFVDLCVFLYKNYNDVINIKNNLLLLQLIFENENSFSDSLFQIIDNEAIELNLKLEACDILLLKGSEKIKNRTQHIIKTILPDLPYSHNSENAHLSSVVASIDKTLEKLLLLNKGKKSPLNLHEILLLKYENNEKIKGSLNRIFNYNFLKFSKYKLTLKEIIENIWVFIDELEPELKAQLLIRLEQELGDMYNSCSQGYASRLINVFSGFQINGTDNLGITISHEDEIYAIFSNKVNNAIINAPQSIKEQLLEELMIPTNIYENRLNLTRYLRPFLPKIWNEIFEIFKDELTVTDLDLYCRKVTMKYEEGFSI